MIQITEKDTEQEKNLIDNLLSLTTSGSLRWTKICHVAMAESIYGFRLLQKAEFDEANFYVCHKKNSKEKEILIELDGGYVSLNDKHLLSSLVECVEKNATTEQELALRNKFEYLKQKIEETQRNSCLSLKYSAGDW
tara:strand:+ start:239 stop:649 length:411 start_codon:yes stop_codon:yes gene_type:complete